MLLFKKPPCDSIQEKKPDRAWLHSQAVVKPAVYVPKTPSPGSAADVKRIKPLNRFAFHLKLNKEATQKAVDLDLNYFGLLCHRCVSLADIKSWLVFISSLPTPPCAQTENYTYHSPVSNFISFTGYSPNLFDTTS